jgi:hypothetical protein
MRHDSFATRDPFRKASRPLDAAQVSARMDEYLAALGRAGEPEQATVGYGLNIAHKLFIDRFKAESAFRSAGEETQNQFLLDLHRMVEGLDPNNGATWGLRLFWMYARLMMESDPGAALRYAPALEQLGQKGRAIKG